MQWNIGDRIDHGIVVGILTSECFLYNRNIVDYKLSWDKRFPNWRNENVLCIKFDIPTKQLSMEEFLEYYFGMYNNTPGQELAEEMYTQLVPTEEFMYVPEQAVSKCPNQQG
jgi:hypothetical protein